MRDKLLMWFCFIDLIVEIMKVAVTVYSLIKLFNDKCEYDGTDIYEYIYIYIYMYIHIYFFLLGAAAQRGPGPPHS